MHDAPAPTTMSTADLNRRIALGLAPALVLPFVAALFYFVLFAGKPGSMVLYSAAKVFTIIWPLLALLLIERRGFRFLPLSAIDRRRSILWGLVWGVAIAGSILLTVYASPASAYVREHAADILAKVNDFRLTTPTRFIAFAVFISLIHSAIEEYYWRWYVYGRLTALVPPIVAHVVAALAFASHHYIVLWCYFSPVGAIFFGTMVGVGGILWSVLYRRTGSLVGSWLSHVLTDAAIMVVGYRLAFG